MHVNNLYKKPDFLTKAGPKVYAMEKVHGSSANVRWDGQKVHYHAGGESSVNFQKLFDDAALTEGFKRIFGDKPAIVHGEVYGGKCQKMSDTYGKAMQFIAFDVFHDDKWFDVHHAHATAIALNLEFVPYEVVDNTVEALDAQRDRPSVVAERRGMGSDKRREGIVVRPLQEIWNAETGERLIVKHKGPEFRETATPHPVVDTSQLPVLEEAKAIANEWVVEERLNHVIDKLKVDGQELSMRDTPRVLDAMVEDVKREAEGEIVWSDAAEGAIRNRTRELFKAKVKK
jgi:hypothetical protein